MGGTGLGGPYGDGLDERYMDHLKMKTKEQPSANPLYILPQLPRAARTRRRR